jgi:hypothetical protein
MIQFLLSLITSRSAPLDESVEQTILNSLSNDNVSERPLKQNKHLNLIGWTMGFTSYFFRSTTVARLPTGVMSALLSGVKRRLPL